MHYVASGSRTPQDRQSTARQYLTGMNAAAKGIVPERFTSRGAKDSKGNYWGGKNKLMIPRDASGTLPDTIAIVDAIRSDAKAR
jgi:hypothetical protein